MSAAYTLVPELRFPEFQKDKEWLSSSLGQLGEIVTGKTPSTKDLDLWNGEIPFITPTDISENSKYQYTTQRSVAKTKNTKTVPSGSIVYTCIASIGKMAVTSCESLTNQQINSVIVRKQHSSDFVYYSLLHQTPRIKNTPASSTLPIINKTEFSKLLVPKPDLPEQQKIADCLGSLDDLIAAHRRKLAALQDHKKGLLQQLFPAEGETNPKLRFPEFEGKWEEKSLKELAVYRRGSFPQPYGNPEWFDEENGTPFIQVYDVAENLRLKPKTKTKISKLGAKKSVFIPEGTLIITIQGSIGRVAITQYDAYIDRTLLLFKEFKQPVCKEFFAQALFLLFEIEKGKAPGGIIKTITKEALNEFALGLPSIAEQQKIADCLSDLDALLTTQTEQIAALKAHKKGLMQKLFPNPDQ